MTAFADTSDEQAWLAALDDQDDFASAWKECRETGKSWGGRGFGGRGVARQYQCMTGATRDVCVDGVTLAFAGRELLTRTTLRFTQGRTYALTGRNGVGKSTLLRRVALGRVPGFPPHLRVHYVSQDLPPPAPEIVGVINSSSSSSSTSSSPNVVTYLLQQWMGPHRAELLGEQKALEDFLDGAEEEVVGEGEGEGVGGEVDEAAIAERLCEVDDELEMLEGDRAEDSAVAALKGLGFVKQRRAMTVAQLSGGWRMRLELAVALLTKPDLLLLDEPTNHLDLHGVLWLESFLCGELGETDAALKPPDTVVLVSHDRDFLAATASDVIVMENQALRYFSGTMDEFEQREGEAATAQGHRLDARVRQEKAARASAEKMHVTAAKTGNDKLNKQAKQKANKVERIGLYREDGKAFKTMALAKIGVDHQPLRAGATRVAKEDKFSFPMPMWDGGFDGNKPVVSFEGLSYHYDGMARPVLTDVVGYITRKSRVAVVGDNGAGKTTLLRLILGTLQAQPQTVAGAAAAREAEAAAAALVHRDQRGKSKGGGTSSGSAVQSTLAPGQVLKRDPTCRVAHVAQHHAEALDARSGSSSVEYCTERFKCSSEEARARLGKFGITGTTALQPMSSLSGGQKARVSLTAITWSAPHVLLLDEPTNHLDMSALTALADALRAFDGAVVLISHNRAFVTAVCNELWTLDAGTLVRQSGDDEQSFTNLFSAYAASVRGGGGSGGGEGDAASRARATNAAARRLAKTAKKQGNARGTANSGARSGFF